MIEAERKDWRGTRRRRSQLHGSKRLLTDASKNIGAFRASMSSGDVSLLAQQELGLYAQRWAGAGPSGHHRPVAVGAAVKGVSHPGSRVPVGRDDPAQIDP